jgi:hypothetical protein
MAKHVTIDCFRSDTVVVRTKAGSDVRKIFSVSFSKTDGSLFINLPYFETSKGLLSIATIPGGQTGGPIDLKPQGKCSSHNVKYAHHISGEAHFSQTGKILTKIKRQSVPLRSNKGHIFTLLVQGLQHFKAAVEPKDNVTVTKKRTNLTVDLGNASPEAVKFVGRVFDARLLGPTLKGEWPDRVGPLFPYKIEEGDVMHGICIGNPHDTSDQTLLLVTYHVIPRLDPTREAAMMFVGGFDPAEQVLDPTRTTSMIALNYPAENFEDLRAQIGSVDFVP